MCGVFYFKNKNNNCSYIGYNKPPFYHQIFMTATTITAQGVSVQVPDKTLLSDISFTLQTGKIYGLIGHNGSGKSTLIKLLAGEQKPSSGTVNFDGMPLYQIPAKQLARHIAYLPQKLPLAPTFSVDELVMLGRYPYQGFLQKPTDKDRQVVADCIDKVHLSAKKDQMVATLSGGERARAWLAMCLAQESRYLLLDEPLAALDVLYQVEVLKLIRSLVDNLGLGVVIIIHDLNLAAAFCDEFIALKQGKICHTGAVNDIMDADILADIFGIKLHLFKHPIHGRNMAVV